MRLIDADVLWSRLVPLQKEAYWKNKAWGKAINKCIGELENSPTIDAEPSVRWIPCSERLPKDGVYLVYAPNYQGGSSSSKEWHDGVMFSKRKNGKWSVEYGYYSRPNCVKAWMPLPKPYEVKEDEID